MKGSPSPPVSAIATAGLLRPVPNAKERGQCDVATTEVGSIIAAGTGHKRTQRAAGSSLREEACATVAQPLQLGGIQVCPSMLLLSMFPVSNWLCSV